VLQVGGGFVAMRKLEEAAFAPAVWVARQFGHALPCGAAVLGVQRVGLVEQSEERVAVDGTLVARWLVFGMLRSELS
jgi:hypothetical protein